MNTPVQNTTSVSAILSLIFGVVSWLGLPFFGAIIAIVCGHVARGEIRRAPPGAIQGDGLALAGLVLGYLHLALFMLATFALLTFFGGFAWLAAHLH
ncbi:DUF4190 domain-containing protein [Rudaea cellulosilytica]|uniref:DUF4190 domain-containing protein n=1 Tax=Rudaea cellulosilytica TaxID=540746 RepID=UPI00037270F5|nr:DUF4190 domain-containing protein [Rudaea cellulosilytica]